MATIGKSAGVEFRGLFLITEIKIREQRVGVRVHDASDADAAVVRAQEGYELGTLTWPQIDTSGAPEQTLERALAHIA
jgi:predicted kinase